MLRKIENGVAVFLVLLLSVLPLILKFLQGVFAIPVIGGDVAQLNIVFVFACVAGIITWRENNHISLASLSEKLPGKPKKVIMAIRAGVVPCVLEALFLASFSEMFMAFTNDDKVWGIPLKIIFAVLPLMYLMMLIMVCSKKDNIVSSVIGILIGLYVSMGPVMGILYSIFGVENFGFLSSLNDSWLSFSASAFIPLTVLFILCALIGVPLFVCISGIAYVALSQGGGYVDVLSLEAYNILTDKSIAAIPLFTIAGYILSKGSAGSRLVEVFNSIFGWFKGGTVVAAVIVATFFTTFTGISSVTILALGGLLTIALTGTGYEKDNAQSLITVSGAIGLLFPPSIAIIMYGTTNYFSVDVFDLFKGAVIPGCLLAVVLIAMGIFKDNRTSRPKFSIKAVGKSLKIAAFELIMPVLIIVGYFSGFFSLMEAASFAVVYAFCLETFVRRDYTIRSALKVVAESIPVTGGVLVILAAARGLSYYLIDANIPDAITSFIMTYIQSKYLFLFLMNILLLIAGCLMDIYSAILIISPLLIPVAESFGISSVHCGVIFLMNMQLGFLTPPVGMDLFIASYAFEKPVMKVVKGVLPYLAVEFIVLMLVTYIPWFTSVLL